MLRQTQSFTKISALKALHDVLVRSRLECNAIIWSPHEAKYKIMLERIQNKFKRHLYAKIYAVYPFYSLMYPSLFVHGTVGIGYNRLEIRREFVLGQIIFKILTRVNL